MPRRTAVATIATVLVVAGLIAEASATHAASGVHRALPFSATLSATGGSPITGSRELTFRLYSTETGGTALWTESYTGSAAVSVTNGRFSVQLGARDSLGSIDFNSDSLYLGITVVGDSELSPRIRLGAAPYALNADTLDGRNETEFAFLAGRGGGQSLTGGTGSQNDLRLASTTNSTKGKVYLGQFSAFDEATVRFGIGTTTPAATLQATATDVDQLRLAFNDATYLTLGVSSSGGATLDLVGSSPRLTIADALTVSGATTVSSTFAVTGASTLAGATTLSASGTALTVTNNATIGGNLTVTGTLSAGTQTFTSASVSGSLAVTGASTLTGAVSTGAGLTVGTDLTVTGNDIVFGNAETISNATDGTVAVTDGTNNLLTVVDAGTTGNVTATGTLTSSGAFAATTSATVGTTLGVTGASTLTGLVTATAGVTTPVNLTTTGTGDLVSADDLTVADDVTVTGQLNNVSIIDPSTGVATLALAAGSSFVTTGAFSITLTAPGNSTFTLPTVSGGSLVGTSDTGTVTSGMILNGTIVAADLSASTGSGNTVVLSTSPTVESPALHEFTTRRQNFSSAGTDDSTAEWTGENVVFLSRAGTQTFNLGAASSASGALVTILVTDTSNNNRTVNETSAGGLLDLTQVSGNVTLRNNQAGDTVSLTVYSDGTNWRVLSRDTR